MKVSLDTGNFTITVDGEYSPEAQANALKNALKYELQRDVVTKAYIALVGVDGKKGDSKVLPKGFVRDSVKYDDESAAMIRMGAEEALAKRGEFDVTVTQHVAGVEGTPTIEAQELWKQARALTGDARETVFANLGIESDADEATGVAACKACIQAEKAKVKAAIAAKLGIQPPKGA